jgi:hypothetical protein
MKKIFTIFLGILFSFSLFGQSYLGETKKEIMKIIKSNNAMEISKEVPYGTNGDYSITARFNDNTNVYSFTKNDICFFYVVLQNYDQDVYFRKTTFLDERYLRVKDEKDVWKEALGEIFVYRWIVLNYNRNLMYTLYMTQSEYERNKYLYLENMLK